MLAARYNTLPCENNNYNLIFVDGSQCIRLDGFSVTPLQN